MMNEELNLQPTDGEESIPVGDNAPAPAPKEPLIRRITKNVFDYLELFACSVFAVLIIFTFGIRLCRVDGESMENTLYNGENLLLCSLGYEPRQDDIVVFHLTNPEKGLEKTLVKRVIATENQSVVINTRQSSVTVDGVTYEGNSITVDGVTYADTHSVLKDRNTDQITNKYDMLFQSNYDPATGLYRVTVPAGKVFVLGDNRNNSKDSRSLDIGFVDEDCVLGKVILRIAPFTVLS